MSQVYMYEGKLSFYLHKSLPDHICNKLINYSRFIMNEFSNVGYDFILYYLYSPKKTYAETPIGMFTIAPYGDYYAGGDNFVAYRFDISIYSQTFDEDTINCLINKLRPFFEKTAPNIIGTVTRTDGKYKKTFYIYEALTKTDLIEAIDNMMNKENEDEYNEPDFKFGFTCALDLLKEYIQKKSE